MKIIEEPPRSLTAVGAERWVVDVIKTEKMTIQNLKQKRRTNSIPEIVAKLHTESLSNTEGIE